MPIAGLDAAVAAAYGWPANISDEDALAKLLEMNLARVPLNSNEPEMELEEETELASED